MPQYLNTCRNIYILVTFFPLLRVPLLPGFGHWIHVQSQHEICGPHPGACGLWHIFPRSHSLSLFLLAISHSLLPLWESFSHLLQVSWFPLLSPSSRKLLRHVTSRQELRIKMYSLIIKCKDLCLEYLRQISSLADNWIAFLIVKENPHQAKVDDQSSIGICEEFASLPSPP